MLVPPLSGTYDSEYFVAWPYLSLFFLLVISFSLCLPFLSFLRVDCDTPCFSHFYFPASGQAVVTGVVPSPPRFLPSIFIAHRVQQSHCLSVFHRELLTHALALSASQFVHKKKSQRFYTSMQSAGLELTKLTYTRLEDSLIRHRGDRCCQEVLEIDGEKKCPRKSSRRKSAPPVHIINAADRVVVSNSYRGEGARDRSFAYSLEVYVVPDKDDEQPKYFCSANGTCLGKNKVVVPCKRGGALCNDIGLVVCLHRVLHGCYPCNDPVNTRTQHSSALFTTSIPVPGTPVPPVRTSVSSVR